jgi:hypothetical protein
MSKAIYIVVIWVWCWCKTEKEMSVGADVQQQGIVHTTATLSEGRWRLAATSSGEIVFFAGGYNATVVRNNVDMCNVTSGIWTTATLSVPRSRLAAASSENLVLFGGGFDGNSVSYNQVDIYNISDGSWSTATLSQARDSLAATSVGDIVLFGGGYNGTVYFNVVDIYNVTSNKWTTATLSQARYYPAATSVANRYALFAGGTNGIAFSNVDIYDLWNGMWLTTTLSQARYWLAATSLGNLAFFGGGNDGSQASNVVDIFNSTTNTWSSATLSQARYYLAAAAIRDIVAFGGGYNGAQWMSVVDMYNVTNNTWFTTYLTQSCSSLAATSSIDKIFFGGGGNDSVAFNTVDIFEILSSSPPSLVSSSPSFIPNPSSTSLSLTSTQIPLTAPSVLSVPSISATSNFNTPLTSPLQSNESNTVTGSTLASSNSSSSGIIIGVVVAIVAFVIAVGLILFLILFVKRRKRKQRINQRHSRELTMREIEKRGTVVIDNDTMNKTLIPTKLNSMTTIHQPGTETLQEISSGQIPLNELEIGIEIGQGTYGRVRVGRWRQYRVALKFCQNKGKMEEFMREANLMISLPPHPNVVRMYGISIDGTQPIIVMEYCAGGSLDKWLYDRDTTISNEQKLRWVHEIAMGMNHLHKYNIVHRDVAARNILPSHPNLNDAHLKISDFGMSRVLQQGIEGKTLNRMGPIRWIAPESIEKQVYSKKSDVWMFGVLIYEIVVQCEPHVDIDPNQVATLIRDKGLTPMIPNDCPQKLQQLMEMCWKKQPDQRPNFETICAMFK